MASDAQIDAILASLLISRENNADVDYAGMLDKMNSLRQMLVKTSDSDTPAVLSNEIVFKAVFCFLLDQHRGALYLEELGRNSFRNWSTVFAMEPLKFAQEVRDPAASDELKTSAIVVFLCNLLRLLDTMNKSLALAREARLDANKKARYEDDICVVQSDLNKILVSCVHFESLFQRRNDEAVCACQARQMFAGFSILAKLLYDRGEFQALWTVMNQSVGMFELAAEMRETVLDLSTEVSVKFLPKTIQNLIEKDPELSYSLPYRIYWHYLYVQLERKLSVDSEWRVDQQLSNANHYCADEGKIYHSGRYDVICWLLYGLSLFDCGEYATAEAVLERMSVASSRMAAECKHQCEELGKKSSPKQSLMYVSDSSSDDVARDKTAWQTIYEDPVFRRYWPRNIPDYVRICSLLTTGSELPEGFVQSLFLESVGPLVDLAYQPKQPIKMTRFDASVNVYGGSVNESLDLQSHVAVGASTDEVPDIDLMMAVCPTQLQLNVKLESTRISPRYAYLVETRKNERMPSFELLVDSFPIAWNKVAVFVADADFAEEYKILSIAVHGPAVTTKILRGDNTILSYDYVPALWIKEWPVVANEWRSRPRKYGWPSASIIEEIVLDGVLLVTACHPNSEDPNNEWRLSFSFAERLLVDTLSGIQRLAYLYAKLIWTAFLKSSFFLVSYHLKNALLWLCEERPSEFWVGENLVACVAEIFRWLHQEVGQGRLRSYFVPQDNMIPASVQSTEELLIALDGVINNVFQRILEADSRLRHIAALEGLNLGELAESIHQPNPAVSLVGRLKHYVSNLNKDLYDSDELLAKLDKAIDSLQ